MSSPNKDNLRVLQLVSTPLDLNGQTLFPLRISKPMKHVRADFLSYALLDERVRTEAEAMGGEVFIAPHRLKKPLSYIRYVSELVRSQGCDVVHCHGNSCTLAIDLLAAKLGGAKVRIAHSHNSRCRFMLLHRLLRLPFNLLYTHAMACGDEAGKWLFGKKPFSVIRNAIDARAFSYDEAVRTQLRREFGVENKTVIGCVAGLTQVKNHSFLLSAFAAALERNPDYVLALAGDGPLRKDIERQAQELGVSERVLFLGLRTDVPRLLQMMDVMALPSLFEGFPTVALEWQCAGLPMLLADTITRNCAFTPHVQFLPLETAAWTDALLSVSIPERAGASRAGIEAIVHAGFDLSAAAAQLEQIYRNLAGS